MKKITAALLVLFTGIGLFALDNSPFRKPGAGIKSYTEINYEITTKFGDYYRTPSTKFQHNFNAEGLETESIEYSPANKIVSRIAYTYSENKKIASQTCYDEKGAVFWKIITSFDKNGNKAEDAEYDAKNILTGKTVYKYENNNLTDETYYNGKGELTWKNIYTYNEKNQLKESFAYFSTGKLDTKSVFKHDETGKLVEITSYNVFDTMTNREVLTYNDDSTLAEHSSYGSDNKRRIRVFYKYDANKNLVKSTTYNIAQKFGTTVNEMVDQSDYEYQF